MRILILCAMACLLGCSSKEVPDTHLYMLRADSEFSATESTLLVGLATVDVPAYLKRSELILQVGPQELRPARYHRWAEPLDENIRRYLRGRLSTGLSTSVEMNARLRDRWDVQIDVSIEELHGTLDGRALLSASYAIVRPAQPEQVQRGRVRLAESQKRDGYAGLVDVQSQLLDELAHRIATDVNAMPDTED